MRKQEEAVEIIRYVQTQMNGADDVMAIEEPLEIYIDGKPSYLTMRLSRDEMLLALGNCFGERIIDTLDVLVNNCEQESGHRIDIRPDQKGKTHLVIGKIGERTEKQQDCLTEV